MTSYRKYIAPLAAALALFTASHLYAEVVMPRVIGSNMVLQREKPLPIWGTANVGEQVTVKFGKQIKKATTDANGNWKVMLDPLKASAKAETMTITGTNTIKLENILVGEVWICSGQSNMQYEMRKNSKVVKLDSTDKNSPVDELDRPRSPMIRIFWVNQKNLKTTGNFLASWNLATQDSALRSFSAAGYFFAKNLNKELNVPIGVICAAISGSAIEPWTPQEAYDNSAYFKNQTGRDKPKTEGKFFSTMITPLAPLAIRGFLWYQGEANVGETTEYTHKMEAMFGAWRSLWSDQTLPFYYVQIVPYDYTRMSPKTIKSGEVLPEFWEAQTLALNIPHTGMIETLDLDDPSPNLHPGQKWEVGRRLALVALAKSYGKNVVYSGPMYQSMSVSGGKATLSFNSTGSGLINKDGKPLTWFTIAGADGKFVTAKAEIQNNKVIVSSPEVPNPVAVRFAWDQTANPNLFNKEGLPAAPFRTNNPLKFNAN